MSGKWDLFHRSRKIPERVKTGVEYGFNHRLPPYFNQCQYQVQTRQARRR